MKQSYKFQIALAKAEQQQKADEAKMQKPEPRQDKAKTRPG